MESTTSSAEPAVRAVRTPSSAVVILAEGEEFRSAADSVGKQNPNTRLIVVGSDAGAKQKAKKAGLMHRDTFDEAIKAIPEEIEYVWVLAGRARPRAEALPAMLGVAVKHQAALVGSKILATDNQERLLSVGSATDLFGVSSSGLDESELDFAQYDVIREVSSLPTVSLLARRQLWAVLGGLDETIPPVSSGLDFCQRVRLAGGRVVVAPSSRVLYPADRYPRSEDWRERAGRMRAMFKVYRLITLTWAIPFDIAVNLLEGMFSLLLGRPGRLAGFLAAVAWNLLRFPSSISARIRSQKTRVVGDEDLFRYQISGSVILRDMGYEIGGKLGDTGPGDQTWMGAISSRLKRGAPFALLLALLYGAVASRSLWVSGLPAGGFSFPPGDQPLGVLSAFAGGWNGVGLGSPLPPHPSAALTAGVHWLMLGWSGSQLLITAVALWAGTVGASRLFRSVGIGAGPSYLGAVVYLLGVASVSVLSHGYWPMLIALGALPWSVVAAVRPWPVTRRHRIGDLAMICLASTVLAAAAPPAVAIPVAVVILGWLAGVGWSAGAVIRVVVGAVLGLSTVGAYLWANLADVWADGPSESVEVEWWYWMVVVAAGLLVLIFGGTSLRNAAGLGLALGGAGLWAAQSGPWEVAVGGSALAALGAGMTASAAVGSVTARTQGARRLGAGAALVCGVAVLAGGMSVLEGGRAGLPADQWSGRLDFASSLSDPTDGSRLLLIGVPGTLPGMERDGPGYSYRLLETGPPTLEQAWLPPPGVGDGALAEVLSEVSTSQTLRPGQMLAPLGVRWVIVDRATGFSENLTAQVDLRVLSATEQTVVYENLVALPRSDGPFVGAWESVAFDRVEGRPFGGRIRIADNAHPRWGPGWSQQSWWNTISGTEGVAQFDPYPVGRVLGWWAAAVLVVLVGLVWWGRGAFR